MTKRVSYIEIDVPFCANTYGVLPCTASLTSSPPTGTRKCFNTLNTCQDRENYIDAPVTLRFGLDNGFNKEAGIDCIPSIEQINFTPASVSLGKNLGTRASLSVTFKDHRWADTGPGFDPYLSERPYNPFLQGTFWGKFRARQPFLRGRPMRLIRGIVGQSLGEMETRHYLIDSFTHNTENGAYQITAKDLLKFADDDRAQAPQVSQGFLTSDITETDTAITLSPSGIANEEYPESGYISIGGKEIVSFVRDASAGNDANTRLLLHFEGADGAQVFTDSSPAAHTVPPVGSVITDTAEKKFGASSGLFDGGGYLQLADHNDWTFTGNFTIDVWLRFSTMASDHAIFQHIQDGNNLYEMTVSTTGVINFRVLQAAATIITLSSAAGAVDDDGDFHHVALVRDGNDFDIYVDGVSVASVTDVSAIPNFAGVLFIGVINGASKVFVGWMDEFRISGIARWTANFTPPASPYQTSSDILTITRAQFETEAQDHSSSDRAQLVLVYDAMDVADIIHDLLVNYADVPDVYIPLPTWKIETDNFLGRVFTAAIAEPVGVQELINELIEDAALVIWWDDLTPELRLRVLRKIADDAFTFDQDTYMADTYSSGEQPNERISQIWRFFAKRNPLEPQENDDNYRSVAVTIDLQAETDYGSPVIKKIYSRWIPFGGRSIADKANDLYLSRYRDPPRSFQFSVFRNDLVIPELGQGYRIKGMGLQNDIGEAISTPIQITRLDPSDTQFEVEAQEMLLAGEPTDLINRVIIIDSHSYNVSLRDLHDTLFPPPTAQDVIDGVNLTCIIVENIIVGGVSSFSTPPGTSFNAGEASDWPVGFPITVVIDGRITGGGGRGGTVGASANGFDGGTAIYTRFPITVTVAGQLWGGGGGGGAGQVRQLGSGGQIVIGGGGGGGAGKDPGIGGFGNNGGTEQGGTGTDTTGGAGTPGSHFGSHPGGAGGNIGQPGVNGTSSGSSGNIWAAGLGGAAGPAIDGDSFVTLILQSGADIQGPQIN